MTDSSPRPTSLESTVADIAVSATELLSGLVRPDEAAVGRVIETLSAAAGVRAVRRVPVQRGQYDDSLGRYRAGHRAVHRIRLPATGEAVEVELAGVGDPEWTDEEQLWRLHSVLTLVTAATTSPRGDDPVEQLLWHTRAVVVHLDRDGWSVRSSAGYRVLGHSPDISRHRTPLSLVDPRDRSTALRAYADTLSGRRQSRTVDLRVLAADGGHRVLEATFVNVPRGRGRRTVAVYAVDMTAQRADGARLRELVLRLDGAVLVTDEAGRVRLVNDAFARLFGASPGGWPGRHQREVLRAVAAACQDGAAAKRRLAAIARNGERLAERLTLAGGRVVDLDHRPLVEQGLDLGALWQFHDVPATDAAASPNGDSATDAATDTDTNTDTDRRDQALTMVFHELRTPLTAVASFADFLAHTDSGTLSGEQRAATEVIARNTRRLLGLVEDLLLSRLERTRLPLRHAPVDVPALVATAVYDHRLEAADAEITLTGEAADGPPLTGDAGRLAQVLGNLVGNALKFSPRGSEVRVRAVHDATRWTITVGDSGIGIPPGELARIMHGFQRGSNAVRAGIAGSGLGLAICRELVELHGGHMSIASTLQVGTEVSVALPIGGRR